MAPLTVSIPLINHPKYILEKQVKYRKLTYPEHQQIFNETIKKIKQTYDASKSIRGSAFSEDYSCMIFEAENLCVDLNILDSILKKRNEEHREQVTSSKNYIEKMYRNLPNGERCLLQKDLKIIFDFTKTPGARTYKNSLETYYNPTISLCELWKWFIPYVLDGDYESPVCNLKTNRLGKIALEGMATSVTLIKKVGQKQIASTKDQNARYSVSINEEVLNISKIYTEGKKSFIILEFPPESKKRCKVTSAQTIEKLNRVWQTLLEVWNFGNFKIFTPQELIASGYSLKAAHANLEIVFYHKKVENPELPLEKKRASIENNFFIEQGVAILPS